MLFKRAGSPCWYVRFRDASGRRVKRTTGTTDRREAEELEGKWRLESRQQRLWGIQPRFTFDQMMLRYLQETQGTKRSAERDAWTVKRLKPYFSGRVLNDLKRSDVRGYVASRTAVGVKGSTINRELGMLSSALNRARLDWDWDIPNPAQGMREREPEGRKVIGPSLSLELPIFDQGQARIAKLVAETRRARRHADALAVEIRSEVREQANRLLAARSLAEYLKMTVIPLR